MVGVLVYTTAWEDGVLDLFEIEDEFLRNNVLDGGSERDGVVAGESGQGGVGTRALGDEFLRS